LSSARSGNVMFQLPSEAQFLVCEWGGGDKVDNGKGRVVVLARHSQLYPPIQVLRSLLLHGSKLRTHQLIIGSG
jgi:hypothetical protein